MHRRFVALSPLLSSLTLACSDPAPAPPQGALIMGVTASAGSNDCSWGLTAFSLPSGTDAYVAIRDHAGQDPETGEVFRAVDGKDKTTIECSVKVSGDQVTFSGKLSRPTVVSFSASGNIDTDGGTIRIGHFDNQLGDNLHGDCELNLKHVSPGAIWGDFACADFTDGRAVHCSSSGTFVFENCDK
jgi:hypothetical protein